jgi:hypothetical protein
MPFVQGDVITVNPRVEVKLGELVTKRTDDNGKCRFGQVGCGDTERNVR